ncbi:mucin-13 isoform X1 [Neofelis nebulosa]|uniref:mucin-13 isoform X1 n=1 Tax=Neofelis nebulosa TaxID=61452 RepID=UPI00272CD5EE|nr:mucin-13 isoform X1 [Neofelis nebulosa]
MTGLCTQKRVKTEDSWREVISSLDCPARTSKMKAFPHLALLILLFGASAMGRNTTPSSSTTVNDVITAATTPAATTATTTDTTPTTTTDTTPTTTTDTTPTTTTATTPTTTTATTATTTVTTATKTPPTSSVASVSISSSVTDATVTSTTSKSSPGENTTAPTPGCVSSGSNEPTTVVTSPETQTTETDTGSSLITVPQSNSSEAVPSVTSGNVTSPEIRPPNPGPPDPSSPCQGAPCKGGSSCVSLNDTYFCLCSLGYYYNSSTCKEGKLFPGTITVKVSETSGLEDENSMAYQKLHIKVTEFFVNAFNSFDYGQTIIRKVSTSPSARSETRAGDKDVSVEVVNIFTQTTKEDEVTVSESIQKAIENNKDDITGYIIQSLCDYYGCEKENQQDKCDNGLLCKCKPGMERPNPQIPVCVASAPKCPDTCNADHNKQCLLNKNSGRPECVCLSGYEEDDHGICRECAFGYNGVNCKDQFQLILTIVGSIAGILVLGLVIALIFSVRSKNKNKNIEEQNLIENDFQNLRLKQTTGFSNLGADGSIFPKIRTNVPSQLHNPYANQRSMPRPDY